MGFLPRYPARSPRSATSRAHAGQYGINASKVAVWGSPRAATRRGRGGQPVTYINSYLPWKSWGDIVSFLRQHRGR